MGRARGRLSEDARCGRVHDGTHARGGGSYGAVGEIDERAHCLLTAGAKGGCRHAVGASSPGPRT
jgi:hypothetical protein